jgi:hypothetical protein
MDLDGGKRIEAASIVDELNIAMNWLSYPGRANRTAAAGAVEIGAGPAR